MNKSPISLKDLLIQKHFNQFAENNLHKASLDHFIKTGTVSGSLRSALHQMMEDYRNENTYDKDMSRMIAEVMIDYKKLNIKWNADQINNDEYFQKLRSLMHEAHQKWQERVFRIELKSENDTMPVPEPIKLLVCDGTINPSSGICDKCYKSAQTTSNTCGRILIL